MPKKALLTRILVSRAGRTFLALGTLVMTLALGVFTYYYVKYSNLIETKLRTGPYANTSMLFAAPQQITLGDPGTPADIVAVLRRSGYSESKNSAMGSYNVRPDAVEIYPGPESYFRRDGGVIKFAGGKVSQIVSLRDNSEITQYMLEPELITNLFDKSRQKRRVIHFDDCPQVLVNAVLAAEDQRFFEHAGFDPIGIARAVVKDATGKRKEGASTLTQQLAGTLLLDRSERTWKRKIPELLIALRLEEKLTKKEIFEYYANTIYLGQRGSFSIQGFGEGAQVYFGKDVKQLKIEEAALLAGLIQSPNMRNPFRNPDRAKGRRNTVLGMMRDDGFITPEEHDRAAAAPLKLVGEEVESSDAPFFVDLVNESLQSQFQDRDFQANSYKVYTSLDMDLQRDATAALRVAWAEVEPQLKRRFKGYGANIPEAQAALIAIDPHTGEIKALVGGRNYGTSQFNRILSRRPPGSVFKPFVYTAAMNTGLIDPSTAITPVSTFVDEPTTFFYDDRTYEPSDFHGEFYGTVSVRKALAKSLNIPTVKIAEKVGYATVLNLARQAGMNIDAPPTPAIALGSSGVTPIEVAGAYTIFANRGTYVKPNFLLQIRDQQGSEIYEGKPERRAVLDPRVSYIMTNLLEEVTRSGTAAGIRSRGFALPAAGKTGSSHDAWFAGYTSKLLCVVWVGFDDYRDVKLEGAKAALPLWTEFMKRAHTHPSYKNVTGFDAPEGIVTAEIDPDSGQLATTACPVRKTEVFIAGTTPVEMCRLHGGGATQVASWDTPNPQQEVAAAGGETATQKVGSPRRVQTIQIPPTPAPQAEPPKRKGFFDRVRSIFK